MDIAAKLNYVDDATGLARLRALAKDHRALCTAAAELYMELYANGESGMHVEHGYYRSAFIDTDVVYKIPTSDETVTLEGCVSTLLELSEHRAGGYAIPGMNRVPIAPCHVLWYESGLPILVMERVGIEREGFECDEAPPHWAGDVDGRQVGWCASLDGWAVYDAGCLHGNWQIPIEVTRAVLAAA